MANVGTLDRVVRAIAGVVLLAIPFVSAAPRWRHGVWRLWLGDDCCRCCHVGDCGTAFLPALHAVWPADLSAFQIR